MVDVKPSKNLETIEQELTEWSRKPRAGFPTSKEWWDKKFPHGSRALLFFAVSNGWDFLCEGLYFAMRLSLLAAAAVGLLGAVLVGSGHISAGAYLPAVLTKVNMALLFIAPAATPITPTGLAGAGVAIALWFVVKLAIGAEQCRRATTFSRLEPIGRFEDCQRLLELCAGYPRLEVHRRAVLASGRNLVAYDLELAEEYASAINRRERCAKSVKRDLERWAARDLMWNSLHDIAA